LYLVVFGESAVGIVVAPVGNKESQQPDDGAVAFVVRSPYLRLSFTDDSGQSRKVTSDMSVSPKKFRIGDEVPLLYRRGHPKTFVVNRFWMKWFPPMCSIGLGLILAIPALVIIANVWPAVGAWMLTAFRVAAPVLVPVWLIGGPILFSILGAWLTCERRRRLRQDYRTQGTILATGWNRSLKSRWIRVAYRDSAGQEQTRTLPVISGMLSRDRREGQTVDLLVDRSSPQDVLLNEPGEL
jgi:hypothetical protein